jgi:hypothetical protein
MRTPEQDHALIARLSASLPLRPDAERVRALLAEAFIAHTDDLWPDGRDQGPPEWIKSRTFPAEYSRASNRTCDSR